MHNRLYNFLEVKDILHPLQFGFRKKHSIQHTLISMTKTIKKSIDNDKFGCGIFIDLKKAFNTFNHTILLKKTRTLWYSWHSIEVVRVLFIK